jgi:hypothetical protein
MPLPARPPAARRAALRLEPLEDRAVPAAAVGFNLSGGSGNTFAPPDSDGAIGPANYVQFINGRFAVYTKTGSLVGTPKSDRAFWNAALSHSGLPGVTDVSDPRILYDPLSDRWFASQITIDVDVGNLVLVGRSDTNNPAGSWHAAEYLAVDANTFGDFDTLGLDANGVYIGTSNFDAGGTQAGSTLTSIPKADLLLSIPSVANRTSSAAAPFFLGQVPVGVTNFVPNPAHASVLSNEENAPGFVRLTTLTGTGGANAQFGPQSFVPTLMAPDPTQAHQPDGTSLIDPLDARFGSTVYQVGDLILGVRSFRNSLTGFDAVRLTVFSDSRRQVLTEATWGKTGFDYIDPSVAMNAYGDLVIGFTRSGVALGSGATDGRLGAYAVSAFLDPNNPGAGVQFGSEFKLKAGSTTAYHMFGGPFERWGDFSATSVDPTDPTSFWTTQEYAVGPRTWGTRISQIVVSPRVAGISSTVPNGTYGFGAVIPITVTFNAPVVVTGAPQLDLAVGVDAVATYTGGSGTNTLTFTYTARHSDFSNDLDYVSPNALDLNGGTIKLKSSKVSLDAILTLPIPGNPGSLGANKDIVIDTRPKVTGGVTSPLPNGTYHTTAVIPITVTFNGPVDVTGTPQLLLNAGSGAVANYASGSGTGVLTFNYTVQDGQQSVDLDYSSSAALVTNGGSIQDHFGGLAADLTLPNPGTSGSLGANKNIVIDGLSPVVVGVTSSLADGSYGFAQVIPITVAFNKPVAVSGTPELALNSGGTATYTGGTATSTLSFNYTVGAGDFAADLDAASPVALTGGGITDQSTGLDAYLAVPVAPAANSLAGSKNIAVDARPAELQDVTSTKPDGAYGAGVVIPITVTFSKLVDVTGTPLLALNSGGTATYTGGNGTFTALTFTYTIQAGENAADLDAASATALTLNGGTIRDHLFGTPVPLNVPVGAANPNSLAAQKNLVIDTTAPSVVDYRVVFGSKSYSLNGSVRFDLPWRITGIQVVFDEPIAAGAAASLTGLAADRLTGLGTTTLTWRLSTPLVQGSPATALADSGPNALTDPAGNPIRPFSQGFNVLWGDFDGNGVVDGRDEAAVRGHQAGPYQPGSAGYNLFADLSGDGIVNLVDVGIARSRNGTHL